MIYEIMNKENWTQPNEKNKEHRLKAHEHRT